MKKFIFIVFALFIGFSVQAQIAVKSIQTDTILKRITTAPATDTVAVPEIGLPTLFGQNLLYKLRLDSIAKTVPLDYNEYVQSYIDIYVKRKSMYSDMLGLSSYYFPIFEKALRAHNVPAEIKYLPIVESSMNPHAISRVGATGLWQFMFGTAKGYGLNMDNFIDERKDPIESSYAAAAYFRDAYEEFGDWLLAIAAYNCGMGNVKKAIDRSGSTNFWELRSFLPKETRNYVPAFIAAVYVMKYAKTHQIEAKPPVFSFKTDTVQVRNFVSLGELAEVINFPNETLIALNPSYKKKIVNGTATSPKRVVIPRPDYLVYDRLFEVLNKDIETDMTVFLASTDDVRVLRKRRSSINNKNTSNSVIHKVMPGQTLTAIANQYGVEVQDLKVWNELAVTTIVPGQKLKILKKTTVKSLEQKSGVVNYVVKKGDTLFSIAQKFDGATVADIKALNGLTDVDLQPGTVLKIKS